MVPVSPLVVFVPELGDVVSPGVAVTSASKVHGVPLAALAGAVGVAGVVRRSRVIASSIRRVIIYVSPFLLV
jgi:hypothetical protein